jgi:hypothetical protein
VHWELPEMAVNDPGMQREQTIEPTLDWKFPDGQLKQEVEPVEIW